MSDFDFEIARQIDAHASKAKDSLPHWICTPVGEYETNNGNDWCEDCGFFLFRHLRRKDRKRSKDYFFDGGWVTESDSHRFCAHCGCWLRVSLTSHGVEEELDHYRENGIGTDENEAYALSLLINAVSWGGEHEAEVMSLARQYLKAKAEGEPDNPSARSAPSCGRSTERADYPQHQEADDAPINLG